MRPSDSGLATGLTCNVGLLTCWPVFFRRTVFSTGLTRNSSALLLRPSKTKIRTNITLFKLKKIELLLKARHSANTKKFLFEKIKFPFIIKEIISPGLKNSTAISRFWIKKLFPSPFYNFPAFIPQLKKTHKWRKYLLHKLYRLSYSTLVKLKPLKRRKWERKKGGKINRLTLFQSSTLLEKEINWNILSEYD